MKNLGLALPDKIQEALQANQSAIDDYSLKFPDLTQSNAIRQISAAELDVRIKAGNAPVLIDVREPEEYRDELGHLDRSRLIPLRILPAKATELDNLKSNEIVVVCRSGVRSTTAAAILTGLGFEHVSNLKAGCSNGTRSVCRSSPLRLPRPCRRICFDRDRPHPPPRKPRLCIISLRSRHCTSCCKVRTTRSAGKLVSISMASASRAPH